MFYLWYSSWYLLGIVVARIASVLWSCVSFINNSGGAVCLLFRMSFFYDGWERDSLINWHVGNRELAFVPVESWNEARLHGKTRNSEVFSPYGNVKETSVSTPLLHLQCWVASVTWWVLCESLMPLQKVLSGKIIPVYEEVSWETLRCWTKWFQDFGYLNIQIVNMAL